MYPLVLLLKNEEEQMIVEDSLKAIANLPVWEAWMKEKGIAAELLKRLEEQKKGKPFEVEKCPF